MFCNKKEVLISQQRARSILWFCLPCVSSNWSEYAGRVEKSLCVCVCVSDATAVSKSKYLLITFETKVTRVFFSYRWGVTAGHSC